MLLIGDLMNRKDIRDILNKVALTQYELDLTGVDENAPLAELQNLNPKFDSMMAIEMIFDVEDRLGVKTSDIGQPSCIKDIINSLEIAVAAKK
jgi:acyl carrier protein